jgi:hypothetical protein
MYLCGKAIHISRPEGKAFKQVLGTPLGGYRRNMVEVQQHTTFQNGQLANRSYHTLLMRGINVAAAKQRSTARSKPLIYAD